MADLDAARREARRGRIEALARDLLATYRKLRLEHDVAGWPDPERQLFLDTFTPEILARLTRLAGAGEIQRWDAATAAAIRSRHGVRR